MNIDTFDIGEVILVTTPRFFNYSFNPLSLYYCYSHEQKEELKLVVLEVHNTFNERHLYICNDTTKLKKTRSGFHSSYRVNRSFHVSPFNNRSGCYEIHLTDIKKKYFECSMTIKNYQETKDVKNDKDFKRFFAQVKGIPYNFNILSGLYTGLAFPVNVFLTSPRILYQAFLVYYYHKLKVFQRPNPISKLTNFGSTIKTKNLNVIQEFKFRLVLRGLYSICKLKPYHSLKIYQANSLSEKIILNETPEREIIEIYIINNNFLAGFFDILIYATSENGLENLNNFLLKSFVKGDFFCNKKNLKLFLLVIFANFDNLKFNVSKDILAIKNNNIGAEVNYDIENSWLKLHKVKFYRFKELRHSLNLMAEKFFNQFINFVEHPLHLDKRIESYHKNYNSPQTKDQLKGLVLQENDIPMLGYLIEFQIDDLIFWENLRYCVFSKVLQEFKDNEITGF